MGDGGDLLEQEKDLGNKNNPEFLGIMSMTHEMGRLQRRVLDGCQAVQGLESCAYV